MKKKVNVFGKSVPVFAIAILGMAFVTAALLPYFGKITGMVTATQGLLVDGKTYESAITETWNGNSFTSLEAKTFVGVHYLDNDASVNAKVNLSRNCTTNNCEPDVTTGYYLTNLRSGTLTLDNKNSSTWVRINDTMIGTVDYTYDGSTFGYTLSATGLEPTTNYVLIYYADKQDRFVNWGGDNPGALLGTFTTNSSGVISSATGSVSVTLPGPSDWNAGTEADYCNSSDSYLHCKGAKIWLVPVSDYNSTNKKLTAWNPNKYLFETDLLGWNHITGVLTNPVTVPAGTELDFVIVNNFPQMLVPDTYTLETKVVPAL